MVDPAEKAAELVFDEVFALIKYATRTIYLFGSRFRTLETTFKEIEPIVKDMDRLSKVLDRPGTELNQIIELMEKGKNLVNKCSEVCFLDFYHRFVYSRKLNEWDEDLKRVFGINLQGITARNGMENLVVSYDIKTGVEMLLRGQASGGGVVNSGGGGGYCGKLTVPKAPRFVVGMDEQYKEVKSRLLQGKDRVVVVSGPGGCGKTTLVEQIYHDPQIQGKFKKNAFYFKVSGSFDAVGIIQEMLHIKGSDALHIHTEDDAFRELEKLLHEIGQDPILLVLDDVWSKPNSSSTKTSASEVLLRKFVLDTISYYKILVTSRFEFPGFGLSVRVGSLKQEDAVRVFLHAATPLDRNNSLPSENHINDLPKKGKILINKIVKCCKGSPLALTVIGRSLCGRDTIIWQSTLKKLSKDGAPILDLDDEVLDCNNEILNCLSKSLDDLSGEFKDCFLDLASFPEDHKIPVSSLIDIWTELYNQDAELHVVSLLCKLSIRSLLALAKKGDDGDGDGDDDWYEDLFAIQHDLLRQLAIHHSSQGPIKERRKLILHLCGNAFPDWWIGQKEQPVNAHILSISTDKEFSHEWPDMEVPAVEVVVLNFCTQKYTLPVFVRKMTKLKALILANNSFLPVEITNFSLLSSLSNLKKIRLERIGIPFLPVTNIHLDNLEKLTLFMCEISKDVLAADDWKGVALPKLLEVNVVYCKNLVKLPVGLCNVASLSKLRITNCPDLQELPLSIGNLLNLKILKLSACTNLEELPDSIGSLQSLRILDISDCIKIEELPHRIGELHNLEAFHMKGMLNLSELPRSINNLRNLKNVTCHKSKETMWNPLKLNLTDLKVECFEEKPSLGWLER